MRAKSLNRPNCLSLVKCGEAAVRPTQVKLASARKEVLVVGSKASWTSTLATNNPNVPIDNKRSEGSRAPVNGHSKPPQRMRQSDEERREGPHIGIYGWRKRCLYLLILTLLVLVVVNLTLTLWVLRVMEFNTEGMGDVRVVEGGLEVRGDAYMMGRLVASSIRSRRGQGITLTSSHNFTIRASDNTLVLGNERLECTGSKFRVSDLQGRTLFSADKNQVIVGADMLKVSGVGGVVFDGSVQTPLVRASPGADLSLESPTRTLQILGPNGVSIESRAGDIKATSLSDLTLKSLDGGIKLEAEKVMIPGLQTGQFKTGQAMVRNPSDVYQLCACQNGRLFLAPSNGHCATDSENLNVCR